MPLSFAPRPLPEPVELDTPRLRLRQWHDDDCAPFAVLNADPVVREFFPGLLDRAASDASVERWRAHFVRHGWGCWALERRDTGAFIGFTGLWIPSNVLPFSPCVEIGWRLAREHWGHGFVTEAGRAALAFGFGTLALEEVVSYTAVGNLRSRAVMARLGLTDARADFDHPAIAAGHPVRRHCLYRITRAQFAPGCAAQ